MILDGQVDNCDEVGAIGRIIRPYAVDDRLHVAFAKAVHVLLVMGVHLLLKLSQEIAIGFRRIIVVIFLTCAEDGFRNKSFLIVISIVGSGVTTVLLCGLQCIDSSDELKFAL